MTLNNINWLAKVFPSYTVLFIPKKEDMEKLLPKPLPPRWEITKCHNLSDGGYSVTLGHINPLQFELREFYNALAENPWVGVQKAEELSKQMQEVAALTGVDMTPAGGKHDYYGNLSITGYPDEQTAREFFESYKVISTSGFKVPGTTIDISLGDLIETFAPKELAKEAKKAMDEFNKGISQLSTMGAKYENGKFLGEEALFISKGEEKVCQAILINNFIITGDILGYSKLPSGKKPVHSVVCQTTRRSHGKPGPSRLVWHGGRRVVRINPTCRCKYCKAHPECSTLEAEDFIYKEKVESLLLEILSKIKSVELPKKEFQRTLVEIAEIEKELQSAGMDILEKSAKELYEYDRENIDKLFELYKKGPSPEFLEMLKSEYFTMRYQVRANQSIRETPPKEYDGYVFLGRSIVKNAITWAVHIQKLKLGKPEDLTHITGGVKVEKGIGEDTFIADVYKKIGEL